jgi:hypothetical protein
MGVQPSYYFVFDETRSQDIGYVHQIEEARHIPQRKAFEEIG